MRVQPALVARACADSGGVARTAELFRAGVDAYSLKAAVRSGVVTRVREGVFATRETPAEVVSAAAHGGVLGCVNRIREAGLWMLDGDDGRVHVSMVRNGRSRIHVECRCLVHWSGHESERGRSTLVDALAQVLACRGEETFFTALESAMRRGIVDPAALDRVRARVPKMHRWLIDFARWNADSGLESLLRLRLHRIGLELDSQVEVPGVGRVDFVLGERLVLEVDGVPGHADTAASRHKDLVRDAVAAAHGLVTLRFDYALVVHDWPLVESAILAAVARGVQLR